MSTSDIAVANYALQKLGADRVESFDQNHPNARSVKAVFDTIKRAELRRYTWGFATRRAILAKDTAQTLWGTHNRFTTPTGFIRLIFDDETGQRTDWALESDATDTLFIITDDEAPLYIKYIHEVKAANLYDPLFENAFATKMAFEMCEEVTGSGGRKASLKDDYKTAIAEAKRVGSIEKTAVEFPEDTYISERR
jgi:hypothetical protein